MAEFKSVFDSIKIKPTVESKAKINEKRCHNDSCKLAGKYKAPVGRDFENQYYYFCAAHVKEYNATFNYFNNLGDDQVKAFQKDAQFGHRPTWTMGARKSPVNPNAADPFKLFADTPHSQQQRVKRQIEDDGVGALSRKAFATLGLETSASSTEIKAKFKMLAKNLHPDSNAGDRAHEDELAKVMQAYKQLKANGFCK